MSSSSRRPLLALTAAAGALAALSFSSAAASADEWSIGPADSGTLPSIISESGFPPFYQSIVEQGDFRIDDITNSTTAIGFGAVPGEYSSTASLGMSNVDFVSSSDDYPAIPHNSVIDIFTLGNIQNQYVDLAGLGPGGTDKITDTLVTPFGDFHIPVSFDAAAFDNTALPGAAAEAAAALPAAVATTFTVIPDPGDGTSQLVSAGGIAPFYTTVDYSGTFEVENSTYDGVVIGNAEYYSDMFGLHNVLLQVQADAVSIPHGIIDDLSFGNGWENVYTDFIDSAGVAPNTITDTLITPFGDFNIPVAYDAVADFPTPLPGAAADFLTTLSADWSTLVSDVSALF